MQLKIQRSQRMGGLTGSTVHFCLDVRADYTPDERESIQRYKMGGQIVYANRKARRHADRGRLHLAFSTVESGAEKATSIFKSAGSLALARLHLNISVASLGRGHHIECKDLDEMMEAEGELRTACQNVSGYLAIAETFNGTEVVIGYDQGKEQVELRPHAPPLLTYDGSVSVPDDDATASYGATETAATSNSFLIALSEMEETIIDQLADLGLHIGPAQFRIAVGIMGIVLFAYFARLL